MVGWSVEAELVAEARGGRQEAVDELVGRSLPLVYNIVGRALSGRADVDDVVQETMLRVLRGLPDLRDDSAFRSWLAAVTMNQIRRHVQARAGGPRTHERTLDELATVADPGADFEDLTLTQLGLAGQRRETVEATRWLDQDDRELLSLWWLVTAGHLTRAELAAALGVDPHHVTVRVGRMKAQLDAARVVVRALAARPGCPELARTVHLWDGRPSALWRKRLARHMRECGRCGALGADLVPPERLLVGLALVPLPAGYAAWLLSRIGAADHLATAADAFDWHPDRSPYTHPSGHPATQAGGHAGHGGAHGLAHAAAQGGGHGTPHSGAPGGDHGTAQGGSHGTPQVGSHGGHGGAHGLAHAAAQGGGHGTPHSGAPGGDHGMAQGGSHGGHGGAHGLAHAAAQGGGHGTPHSGAPGGDHGMAQGGSHGTPQVGGHAGAHGVAQGVAQPAGAGWLPRARGPVSHRRVPGAGRVGPLSGKPLLLAAAATVTVTAAIGAGALLLGGGASGARQPGSTSALGAGPHSPAAQPVAAASAASVSASPSASVSASHRASASPKPSADPASTPDQAAAQQVLAVINQARAQQGLAPLQLSQGLGSSSTAHNQRMAAGCGLSHDCPGEAQLGARESAAGVQWSNAGENIGTGGPVSNSTSGIAGMAVGLTRSMLAEQPPNDGHRQNILSPDFHHIGIAVTRDASGNVWLTQDFSN
ncbi:RNA polymerase sigma factor (sigma-70 family) [Streptacidiphilus sp. MAP12-33]|uniref:sigma-70 family RNA polymerase sigma factor n=1 Tax=Streptacidiphilus sp. MAP12-33 TaxID=3156266 RepID=UPI003511EBFE